MAINTAVRRLDEAITRLQGEDERDRRGRLGQLFPAQSPIPRECIFCHCTEQRSCPGGCFWAIHFRKMYVCSACVVQMLIERLDRAGIEHEGPSRPVVAVLDEDPRR